MFSKVTQLILFFECSIRTALSSKNKIVCFPLYAILTDLFWAVVYNYAAWVYDSNAIQNALIYNYF